MKSSLLRTAHFGLARWCALLLIVWGAHTPTPSYAQPGPLPSPRPPQPSPSLPALEVTPPVLAPDGLITLTLPLNAPATRFRIGVFERGCSGRITDTQANFAPRDGKLQAALNLQADPGAYDLRVISPDRAGNFLSQPAPLLVPGIDREPGWWLLNGVPLASSAAANTSGATAAPPNAPLFIPGLKRDFSRKPRRISDNFRALTAEPLPWQVFRLPPLREMLAAGYDWAALRATLERDVRAAQARGDRNYLGLLLPTGVVAEAQPLPATITNVLNSLRQIITAIAPDAALIVQVDATQAPLLAAGDIDACAALCDAVVLELDPYFNDSWPVKVARRVAEEQPNFDLPIFVQLRQVVGRRTARNDAEARAAGVDYWMGGATGIINNTAGIDPTLRQIVQRNASLFIGSVTLEDVGILPALEQPDTRSDSAARLYEILRATGRIPLLARTRRYNDSRVPESFALVLGEHLSSGAVESLKSTANDGARIYLEGAPLLDEKGQAAWKLGPLVGATATQTKEARSMMKLEDPWTFGTGRGARVAVEQHVAVTLNPTPTPSPKKSKDEPTGPRVVARLEDGSPAVIINSVGKGAVIWTPHRVIFETAPLEALPQPVASEKPQAAPSPTPPSPAPASSAGSPAAPRSSAAPATRPALSPPSLPVIVNRSTPSQHYYAAVADYLQPRLVQVRGTDPQLAGTEAVRVALRRSPRGTMLLALYNTSPRPAGVIAAIDGVAGVALDLDTEAELPVTTRGYQSEATLTIPAQGWKIIAFADTRKSLEEERNTPRLKAKLRQ
ncbi:MAG: hypothetical protein M3347_15680 [Armatimonadota bacterium]|nr:hypothetical protein [Armatimonadota bacterium]